MMFTGLSAPDRTRLKASVMPRVLLLTLLFITTGSSGTAQLLGYVDSVEVHRTDTIYFAFGSAVLDDAARRTVHTIVNDRPGDLELYLEGHTDAVGSVAANDRLAERRADSTRAVALAAGWPAPAVRLRHFGERRRAIATEGREALNRRVLLRSGLPKRYARVRGRLTDPDGRPVSGVTIARSRYLRDTMRTDGEGYFVLDLPLDVGVRVDAYARGYFFTGQTLVVREDKPPPDLDMTLRAATAGSKVTIEDLYFVGNKTDLLATSAPTLPRLLQFMRLNPGLHVELGGHVNNPAARQGPGTWSYNLAQARAKLIHDYLIKLGVAPHRVTYRGYSNWEMVVPKPRNEEERRVNRRVEIKVIRAAPLR